LGGWVWEDKGLEDKGLEDKGLEDKGLEDKGLLEGLISTLYIREAQATPTTSLTYGLMW
jgi:hypothetical protein